jgi:hypothetical protein
MRFEVVEVTPALAADLLSRNYPENRELREHKCAHLARAIDSGKFLLTHQAIAVSPVPERWLLDGQHRLRSIILANRAVKLVVAWDVPVEAYSVLDSGMSRTISERLKKPRREVSVCTTLFRLMVGRKVPHEFEIELMLEVFGPAMAQFNAVQKTKSTPLDSSPYSSAITLRLSGMMVKKKHAAVEEVRKNLDALRKGKVEDLPPILRAFYRQMHEGIRVDRLGAGPEMDKFCRAWQAFDPERERATTLQVHDHAGMLKEARGVFSKIAQDIFDV